MVVTYSFQDLFEASCKTTVLSLPTFKQNSLKIEFEKSGECDTVYDGQEPCLPFSESGVFHACVADGRRLTAVDDACKAVYEVTFDITGSNFIFNPGDTIGVIPHNNTAEVDCIISHLDLSQHADLPYRLYLDSGQRGKIPAHVPVKSTLRHVLKHCVEIRSVLKKLFILALSRHTKNERERKVLEYLSSKEGAATYMTYIIGQNLCILDLFTIFKSCKPPIEVILSNLPRLLPRPYSIVNSNLKDPNILKICFSVMEIGNRKGLTTGWIEKIIVKKGSLDEGLKSLNINNSNGKSDHKVPIYVRKNISGFSMPDDLVTPLLLIGSGTGLAPFIGFLEQRDVIKKSQVSMGHVWLFFGCRNPKLDFIYKQELNDFLLHGSLNKLSTAFSRVESNDIKYIQDALLQDGEEVADLMKYGAVFVCGDLKMAHPVKEALAQCLVTHSNRTLEEAQKFIGDMQKENRYLVDIWT